MAVKIITDSACDLPIEVIQSLNIDVLPLSVYVDNKEYLDSVNLSSDELYEHMIQGKAVKTAQIPLKTFIEKFETYAQTKDSYIYLAFSSNLSGTYQTSLLAMEAVKEDYPDFDLTIIDTKYVSLGLGLLVVEVAQKALAGMGKAELIQTVSNQTHEIIHLFSVDDLEYLFKGGRVSRTQATIGSVLNIKPILNVQDGFLVPIDKAKGRKKRLVKMLDYVSDHGSEFQTIGIAHTLNMEEASLVKSHFESEYGTQNFIINQLGCVIGAHCGPGVIAIFFKGEL
ncbi:DegV family protein [Fusibacter ferrireducens]|uniref:DegV family protein n=1 Tax=Fusibacter ferrireducens TaxID=2785058 RepID=A0ABR9ZUM1_9FIRM|nr:DegV family protein [Fusibacter ferrireducens]MBF4693274.1 DegV family protein [Fusibacter ferrireducens]